VYNKKERKVVMTSFRGEMIGCVNRAGLHLESGKKSSEFCKCELCNAKSNAHQLGSKDEEEILKAVSQMERELKKVLSL
jgi:hypothetical protein